MLSLTPTVGQIWRISCGELQEGCERYIITTNPIIFQEWVEFSVMPHSLVNDAFRLNDDHFGTVIYKKLLEVPRTFIF